MVWLHSVPLGSKDLRVPGLKAQCKSEMNNIVLGVCKADAAKSIGWDWVQGCSGWEGQLSNPAWPAGDSLEKVVALSVEPHI